MRPITISAPVMRSTPFMPRLPGPPLEVIEARVANSLALAHAPHATNGRCSVSLTEGATRINRSKGIAFYIVGYTGWLARPP
jgi:hypothetical protein